MDDVSSLAELVSRVVGDLADRLTGPMKFRLVLQPLMATIFAVRAGLHDARSRRPAYFWAIFTSAGHRRELLRKGWTDVGRIFLLGVVIDGAYQAVVLRWFYPGEALIVAALLAFVPYLLFRGTTTRLARRTAPDLDTPRARRGVSPVDSWKSNSDKS
jgi:hypothetical protein